MNTSVHHNQLQKPASHWPAPNQNGVVRSFVASRKNYLITKRAVDIVLSLLVILLVLSWLVPLMAIIIKAGSKGPVFFRQTRIGKNGKPFSCIKFRTMIINENADDLPARENDKRITRSGKFLRQTNLDELPQFFNVLAGQMSVVGPRPHMVADCVRFSFVIPSYQFRSLVRPGITGLAQVNGCHGLTPDYDSIILRYYYDAQYVRKAGPGLDIKIIFLTLKIGFKNLWHSFSKKEKKNTSVVNIPATAE